MAVIDVTEAPVWATTAGEDSHGGLPVFGLPGYRFHLIHITALVCQVISIAISIGVVVYILKTGPLRKRAIGDRLVFYLSICDLGFTCSHVMDHAYMEATQNHPPDTACAAFAFFLNQFILAQALFVIFTAVNAFWMVVRERKINTGPHDWRLIVYAMGIPLILGILGTSTGHFGPSGAWCYIDLRKQPMGNLLSTVVSSVIVSAFVLNLVCYALVWLKIKQVSDKTTGKKYHGTAKVMMMFVAVYMMQWVFFVIFCFWAFFSFPHMVVMWAAVFFSNIGGFFNFMAYVVIKKKYQNVGNAEKKGDETSVSVVTKSTEVTR